VMGSFFADAATLATVARRSRYASMPTARVTVSPSARADSLARPGLCASCHFEHFNSAVGWSLDPRGRSRHVRMPNSVQT
jgi:hypothetical protein